MQKDQGGIITILYPIKALIKCLNSNKRHKGKIIEEKLSMEYKNSKVK